MIHREATIKYKGYDPDDLKPNSNKRICCICDICGRVRYMAKAWYSDLCRECAGRKMGLNNFGENNGMYGKSGEDSPRWGIPHTQETCDKIGSGNKGKLKGDKNPAKSIVVRKKISLSKIGKPRPDITGKNNKNYNPDLHKFIEENKNKYFCYCGNIIEIKIWHYNNGVPEYCSPVCQGKANVGDKNPNWKGGISSDPYCEKFNDEKRKEVRDKYNNCDYLTGIHKSICNVVNGKVENLSVHHFDYNKQQGCGEHKWKLIPVSRGHNTIFNYNRSFWKRLIEYSLEYDKEYYKEEDKYFNIFIFKEVV